MKFILYFLFLFFSVSMGGIGWWLERKLTARFQYRVGPPWYQNFIDIMKLFIKETIIPQGASRILFILSPLVSLSSSLIVALILITDYFFKQNFIADIIVIIYLLIIPSLFLILGAFSSANPLALVGAIRETKQLIAYEFVFIVSLVIVIIKTGGSLFLSEIIERQMLGNIYFKSFSGLIAFILAFFYLQAKLGIIPFDTPEAEQEIASGVMIEYSGALLGFWKISKLLLYFSLPLFIIFLFLPGKFVDIIIKYFLLILLITVVKNINPRMRIKDVLEFFWFFLFPLGLIGIFLAINGY
ncbi:MAG: NADH-quinone oxidoreductase subunit H [Candidatus Omnitrophica bacterium]|nr:NADH-quinone oxidoreductase subunit H [Candidatus Omnitrophota bacterium]